MKPYLVLAIALSVLGIGSSALAQTSLANLLPREAREAWSQLERSSLPRPALDNLLRSRSAAPYLACSLPRIAELAEVPGMGDLLDRFASNGQGVAYEIAVAHAYRANISSVSAFLRGNELDGTLRSGTVIESKSAAPRRPEHLLEQLRRRAEGGQKVILALGYRPSGDYLQKLRALSSELGGRVEVHLIPLTSSTYEVLVPGRGIENPCNRTLVQRSTSQRPTTGGSAFVRPSGSGPALGRASAFGSGTTRPTRSFLSRALEGQGSWSLRTRARSNLRASTTRR